MTEQLNNLFKAIFSSNGERCNAHLPRRSKIEEDCARRICIKFDPERIQNPLSKRYAIAYAKESLLCRKMRFPIFS